MTDEDCDAADDLDPMDYYAEFSAWLMATQFVVNSDHLVELLDDEDLFAEFISQRKAKA